MNSDLTVNDYSSESDCDSSTVPGPFGNADEETYFKNIDLSYFAANPLEMLTKHKALKELCLEHGNPEAHYIEGLLRYFVEQDRSEGLFHLRKSAFGDNKEGTYLYGLLMLAKGSYITGKRYLDQLQWMESRNLSDQCWEKIKISLQDMRIVWKKRHFLNMENLAGNIECNRNDYSELCIQCFYYKRLRLFYQYVIEKE